MTDYTYYDCDGALCRITNEEKLTDRCAEVFIAGKGFTSAPLLHVLEDGYLITQDEFQNRIEQL